ncbi:MAG: V-type ATPase, subunit [Deltaproteobacteria bacterium]|jgi:V/A-type H+-transporting ATPase subunit D|nr:V-type ATPase, subunit [Deltaproteobacteria bacterium]
MNGGSTNPSRMSYLLLKAQDEAARGALGLLRSRREALARELFAIADQALVTRDALEGTIRRATWALAVSLGLEGRSDVESAAFASRREIPVSFSEQSFWGVRYQEARWHGIVRSADSRGYFFPGVPGSTHAAAREFEKALEAVLRVVAVETRFRKIGAEIAKATRRINVLNEVILPDLRARMRAILLSLEEREREDIFRMKRFKGRRGDRK